MGERMDKVLFCTVGATPQVVTETVWCLMRQTPPWIPSQIHVVTTAFKLKFVRDNLQTENGPLGQLMGKSPPVVVHVPRRDREEHYSADSAQDATTPNDLLRDVNDRDDAARMGNLILRIMAGITSDPSSHLHVSLAGGRKTMSAHALMALSLVGRPRDTATHVLVDPQFEDHPDFWYPDQEGRLAPKKGSPQTEPLDPAKARITLVPTPAPLMRNRVSDVEDLTKIDLIDLMNKVNLAAALEERPYVHLNTHENSVSTYGVSIKLSPKHFSVYRLLATARQENWLGAGRDGVGPTHAGWLTFEQIAQANAGPNLTPIRELMTQYVRDAEMFAGRFADDDNSNTRKWQRAISSADLRERTENISGNLNQDITRLKDEITKVVGLDAATILAPRRDSKRRGNARFGLTIAPVDVDIG